MVEPMTGTLFLGVLGLVVLVMWINLNGPGD